MPTKTKPKQPIDPKFAQVTLSSTDRLNICESAGLSHKSHAGKAFLVRVERQLTHHTNMLRRLPQRALPTHVLAALRPIARKAAELARLLHPECAPIEVTAELGDAAATGRAHVFLADLAAAADQAIKKLDGCDSKGLLNRLLAEARDQALRDLEFLFVEYAVEECEAADRAEFLTTCEKYLKG